MPDSVLSSALGDIGSAGGVGDLGGGVDTRPSGRGELPSDGAGRNNGVVDPSTVVGSTHGDTGADETVVVGSGAGDIAAGGSRVASGAGDTVAAGSGACDTVAAGSGAGDIGGSVAGEVIATGVGAGEAGADMFRFWDVVVEKKEGNVEVPSFSHYRGPVRCLMDRPSKHPRRVNIFPFWIAIDALFLPCSLPSVSVPLSP